MSEHIVENNPKKELLLTLGGVALFLGIVLLIGISGFLRPAGEHITAETMPAVEAEAPATATEEAAPATAPAADNTAVATATPADATVTPATDADSAVVSAEAGTATVEGTVSQAAVADADLTAEPADGVAAETTEKAPAAQ
jgi:type IV secretory pathway TrbL component